MNRRGTWYVAGQKQMEARSLILEERGNGSMVLVGRWPEMALIDPILIPELCSSSQVKRGEDFTIILPNARAIYRYIADDGRDMVCLRIR
jgi:hypothetical protein